MNEVNYNISRGEAWKRLFIIKDRRTRRKRVPTQVAATVLIDSVKYVLPTLITTEGGVLLSLTPNNTEWLADGEYRWDSVATVSVSPLLTSTPLEETVVVSGTLTVSTYDNLTPMASDGFPLELAVLEPTWTIVILAGQPIEALFNFDPVDVSTWTWIGHAYSDEAMLNQVGTFVFTNPLPTEMLATLDTVLAAGNWWYSIEQVTPDARPMFNGRLVIQ